MTRLNTETLEQFAAENDLLLSDPLICFANMVSEAAVYEAAKALKFNNPHSLISDKAKWFAIGEILSSWPDDLTADQVISEVELATDDVVVWEPFENWDGEDVADYIRGMAQSAQKLIDGE